LSSMGEAFSILVYFNRSEEKEFFMLRRFE
jgi:hypothetical protein